MIMEHPDPDRLALAALPAEPPDPEIADHLLHCDPCHEHVETLRRTVALARAGGAETEAAPPPPRVWQAIVDELDGATTTRLPRTHTRMRPRRWRAVAVPIAASLIALAAGIGIGVASVGGSSTPLARLAPLGPADPAARGTVDALQRDGTRLLVVRLDGVTNTVGADYLEAWLMDPLGGRLVSLGALDRDGSSYRGEFSVPADLPMTQFGTVDISAEKWDGDERHSRVSLLRGPLT